jgi:dipeptidyl-peptidase-4
MLIALALAFGPAAAGEPPAGQALTVKQVMDGGFTQGIADWRWRPGHVELVRVDERTEGEKSRRVLVAMDPERGTTRDLLDFAGLRALVPGRPPPMRGIGRAGAPTHVWAKDGNALCAVVKGDLVWVDLAGGARRRLTCTKSPLVDVRVSPDGRHVSFSRENDLWVVPTAGGAPRRLTRGGSKTLLNATLDWLYPEELGFDTATWWSPDGRRIAYLQMDESKVPRYRVPNLVELGSGGREMFYPKAGDANPQVRVGVVAVEGGETAWIDMGEPAPEYVVRVAFTGDRGRNRLVVATLDRRQRELTVGSVEAGGADAPRAYRVAFTERDLAWISPPPAPRFDPAGGGAFLWRRDGDCLRWLRGELGASPKTPCIFRPLTPDGLDAQRCLYYDWKTGRGLFAGSVHGELTRGIFEGGLGVTEIRRPAWAADPDVSTTARVDPTGAYALVSTSTATTPRRTVLVRTADGEVLREIGDARTEKLGEVELAVPEYGSIAVEGSAGTIRWRLWKPADFDERRSYGLVVHTYGGPGSAIVRNDWGRGPLLATLFCQRGFLVLQADGRGSRGQGRDWMKAVQGRLGILELEDQVRAVREITKRPYVDAGRVGIWGWSFGGTMACNALTLRSDVFRAGVAVAPVTDWRLYDTIYTERYMQTPKDNPEGYAETASVNHAGKMSGHLLLMHGLGDDNVHAQNTLRLVEALIKAGKTNYDMHLYPWRGHGISGAGLDLFTRLVRHFETHLK